MADTLTYDYEGNDGGGWTSRHSFQPDWMSKLNNRFFSVKDGQLYLHNDTTNSVRNNFYGVQYPTTITYILNDAPSMIKIAKTMNLESNKAFEVDIKSYLNDETTSITESTITSGEFVNKEGKWFAYVRGNEIEADLSAKNAYGVGRVSNVVGSVVTFTRPVPTTSISVGDTLLDETQAVIGVIQSYSGRDITVETTPVIVFNTLLLGKKVGRIEGSEIRGYNFEIKLTDNTSTRTEIFASSSELSQSFP